MGKPEGVSNVFLTYFDYFLGSVKTWGLRGTKEGVKHPRQIEHWVYVQTVEPTTYLGPFEVPANDRQVLSTNILYKIIVQRTMM